MNDDDRVFKALADPTRRHLLDRLFERDGRTLTELESELEMTRFGVMKHLQVLEGAGLVVTRRSGREKLHFLNPVPIRLIHDRWIDKYTGAASRRSQTSRRSWRRQDDDDHADGPGRPGLPDVHQGDPGADLGRDHEDGVHHPLLLRERARVDLRPGRVTPSGRRAPRRSGSRGRCWSRSHHAGSSTPGAHCSTTMAQEQPSRVRWDIEPQEGGVTKLTVVHDQLEGAPKTAESVSGGWSTSSAA